MNTDTGFAKAADTDALASATPPDTAGLSIAASPDATAQTDTAAATTQIVFIEGNVPDLQDLLSGLAPNVTAVVLDPAQDGLQQMAAYLAGHNIQNLAGIGIVAHGADGAVQLGTTTLDSATIAGYQAQLQQIGSALAPGGAIQLFGCDVAQDAAGLSFLDQLSQAAGGAAVAASSHLVGDAAGGGSFSLDVNTGAINTGTPFTAAAMSSYQGELSAIDVTAGGSVTYTGGGAPVILDGSVTVTDSNTVTGATVWISGGFVTGDALNFTTMLGITGSYDAATGTLTLSGDATDADYTTALDSISYSFPTNGDPTDAGNAPARTISWSVTDGSGTSTTQTSTVTGQEAPVLVYGSSIDEVGIAAASETVASGTLSLFDAGGTVVGTLAVGATLGTADFLLSDDGNGGTDVTVATAFGTYASTLTLLTNPTSIAATGTIADSNGAAVHGLSGTAWFLTNSGSLIETANSGAAVLFASAGTIVNAASGVIAGNSLSGAGIWLAAGGAVTNEAGGTISGYYGIIAQGAEATVVNEGLIAGYDIGGAASGVYLGAGGSVTNQSGGTISGHAGGVRISGAAGTVVNLGNVHAPDGGGVYLADGGSVSNGASGGSVSSAYINGYQYGVKFGAAAAGTLTNFGTIGGNPGNPAVLMNSGVVINGPSGATGAVIEGGLQNSAMLIDGAGTVVNYGTIKGVENIGDSNVYYGIKLGDSGSISNLGGSALISNYVAVYATSNDTVTNAGTIQSRLAGFDGSHAIVFGGGTNRLIIDPGAVFVGIVSGSGPVTVSPNGNTQVIGTQNGIGTTTLELASSSSTGTLNDLGSQYTGFAAITVDTGANWDLNGINTLANGQTLTDAGTLTVIGALTNDGAITGTSQGIVLGAGGLLTNQSDGLIGGGGVGVGGSGAGTLVNAGSIGADIGDAVSFSAGGFVTNQSGGTISSDVGVYGASAMSVVNAGSIYGLTAGVLLQGGGTVTNLAGGSISGGDEAVQFGAGYANRLIIQAGATFSGLVDGGNTLGGGFASTLELASTSSAGTLNPLGSQYIDFAQVTIDAGATWTLSGEQYGFSTLANAGTLLSGLSLGSGSLTVSNQSTGTIRGGVTANGSATVTNAGSIDGGIAGTGVTLLSGGSATNAAGGVITGYRGISVESGSVVNYGLIDATGTGVVLAAGGSVTNAAGGTISGYYGVLVGGSPGTIVNGGLIDGATGYYGIRLLNGGTVTNQSGGTISGTGDAVLFAAGTANQLVVDAGASFIGTVNGGNAVGSGTISTLELTSAASAGTLSGLGSQFVNFAQVSIDSGAQWTLSGSNTLVSGATLSNAGTLTADGTLFNGGTIAGGRLNLAGGALTNQASGVIYGSYVYGVGGTDSVVNLGSIGGGTMASAIYLRDGGSVTNGAGAQITGNYEGVRLGTGGGTLTNYGTILGTATSDGTGVLLNNGGMLVNGQSGSTAALIQGVYGVYAVGAGVIANYASIIATGTMAGNNGVTLGGGSVSNLGANALIEGYAGVSVGTDSTVTNAGTIASNLGTAGIAVTFGGGDARLIDDPGAVFTGYVDGGGSGTATFELASGSSAGMVSGFGTQITGFSTLVFDSGSQWTVEGVSASGLGGLTIQGFTSNDTIDLTGFVAASETFGGNALVLSDGIGDFETLAIQGTFSTGDFQIQASGGNTEITLQQTGIDASGTATFAGGGSPVVLDGSLIVTDQTSSVLVSATVDIDSGFVLGDVLNFSNTASITGSYDAASGVLTLTGIDTVADYQAALETITYSFDPSTADPTGGGSSTSRGVSWQFNDGTNVSSPASSTLSVVHTAPTITAGAATTFLGGGDPVVVDGSLTVTDADSGDILAGATIAITGGLMSGDMLNFTDGGGITGSYDTSTGTLVLSGAASVAAYQAALQSVTYSFAPSNADPTGGGSGTSRTISWTVDDGVATGTDSSAVIDTYVAPSVTVSGTVTFEAEGTLAVTLAPDLTVSDPDSSGILTGATVVIGGFVMGDVLNFSNTGSITGSYDFLTGTLMLSGADSIADYQAALESVSFRSSTTIAGSRTIDWTVSDTMTSSSSGSSTVNVTYDPPTISGAVAAQATTDEAAISPFAGIAIGDPNTGQTETVTITLSNASDGVLSNLAGGTFNNGTYVVSGSTLDVTQAVDGLVFTPTAHSVVPGDTITTTFSLQVTDSNGNVASDSTTSVIATAVNDVPTITQSDVDTGVPNTGTVASAATPFGALTVADPSLGHTDTVTVTMASAGDGTFSNLSGGSYDSVSGVYTFTGTATDVNAALAALSFAPASPDNGDFVSTTDFSVVVTGPGGTATNDEISVSTVTQNLPGEGAEASSSTISVSSDGSSFAAPTVGQTNEAIVSGPTNGGTYTLPTGYQAIYLGGTADATLSDTSVGGAVLVGNSGNDTISAGADGDTLTGGGGTNTFIASGTGDIIGVTGTSTVQTSGSLDVVYANGNPLTLTDSGSNDAIGLGSGAANLTLTGTGASVFANAGSVDLTDSGIGDAIGASTGSITATLSGSGTQLYGSTGAMSVTVQNTASNVAIGTGLGAATIDLGGVDSTVYGGDGTLNVTVASTATNAQIGAGAGSSTITVAGDGATVFGGSGSLVATVTGNNDLIGLDDGSASITLSGSSAGIYGGSGALSVLDQGVGDIIGAGVGSTTITANGQDLIVAGGSGSLDVILGAGSDTIVGGSGTTTITGGSGSSLLAGSAGGTMTFIGGTGSTVYQAQDGTETFDGSAATANLVLNGGWDASGHDTLIGGNGNDNLYAGTGADTLTGGGGQNEFVFYKNVIAGTAPTDVISDFTANDTVYLAGYGASEAASVLASATSSGGSTTLTLSDNTQITFQNIGSASALTGHLLST